MMMAEVRRRFRDLPTSDQLLLMFAGASAASLLLVVGLLVVLAITRPDSDISVLVSVIDTQLSLIIGAVLGYAARSSRTVSPPDGGDGPG